MSILVDVASCKSGLEAFYALELVLSSASKINELNQKKQSVEKYSDEWHGITNQIRVLYEKNKPPIESKKFTEKQVAAAQARLAKKEPESLREREHTVEAPREREHIIAAKSILEKAQKSDKWRLTQKRFYQMTNNERGEFKRVFGDQEASFKFKREMQFVEQMAKENRLITGKQKDWLSTIAYSFGVNFDKEADKASTRTLAKDKIKPSYYDEEPDMPVQREDGSWYDAETGIEITNPKHQKSYF